MKTFRLSLIAIPLLVAACGSTGDQSGSTDETSGANLLMDVLPDSPAPAGVVGEGQRIELLGPELMEYDGKTMFRGLVLGDGPFAQAVPNVRDHLWIENYTKDPKVLAEVRILFDKIQELITAKDPTYFDRFQAELGSQDMLRMGSAIERGRALAKSLVAEAQSKVGSGLEDKCLVIVAVVFAAVVNVLVAGNHAIVYDTASVLSQEGSDDLQGLHEDLTLMTSESAADVGHMQSVPVWQYKAALDHTDQRVYTDKTSHQLYLGDFDGDGAADRLYYTADSSADLLSTSHGNFAMSFPTGSVPKVGDFDGDGVDDVLFYEAGATGQRIWYFGASTGTPTYKKYRYVAASATPIIGNFNGNGGDEIFWYGPGSAKDSVWFFTSTRGFRIYSGSDVQVDGTKYAPFAGNFVGPKTPDDIIWYCPGSCKDFIWTFSATTTNLSIDKTLDFPQVGGTYQPFVADFDKNGMTDVFWYAPGSARDYLWTFARATPLDHGDTEVEVTGTYAPAVGIVKDQTYPAIFWWPKR